MAAQLAALADEFTVIAWDEPGAGGSSDLPADFPLAEYAHCLAALIEAIGLGPAHVAGLSWGGTVAQELYRHHPELVATLILADTYAGWKGSLRTRRCAPGVSGVLDCSPRRAPSSDPTFRVVRRRPAGRVRDAPGSDDRRRSAREPQDPGLAMAEADLRDLLPTIAVPTLLIWGELDARSPLRVARELEDAIPDTQSPS